MSRSLSVIVPAYNERENIEILYNETYEVLSKIKRSKIISDFEIIIVNDGSTDGTDEIIKKLCKRKGSKLVGISLRKNFGQTAALKAGIDAARGDLIVTMDADLQNDPADIPRLIGKLKEGYDVVSGWRAKRKDPLGKRMASKIINLLRKKMIGDEPHDYGGSLKIYERECLKDLELFGELHRYVTGYLFIKGYKIGEIKVNHRPRKFGKTKYKFNRAINGLLDLFFLKFWASFSHRPLHFFGRLGIYQWALAVIIVIEQIIKAIYIKKLELGPLLALASMLVITGLITIIFGFLFEVTSREYYKDKKIYNVREIIRSK
ncbi:glycosyltransferase [Candidatus Pacearchaeota archaeon]|nr:MAG: glycosyltransferase [Candidatus Pacearchaeota archaeon]